jgi:hypothetical protein
MVDSINTKLSRQPCSSTKIYELGRPNWKCRPAAAKGEGACRREWRWFGCAFKAKDQTMKHPGRIQGSGH